MKLSDLFLVSIVVVGVLVSSLFNCTEVNGYSEMADIRKGFPLKFVSLNLQHYTPMEYPQEFCGLGSPWEDPQRILWLQFVLSFAIVFALLYFILYLIKYTRSKLNGSRGYSK